MKQTILLLLAVFSAILGATGQFAGLRLESSSNSVANMEMYTTYRIYVRTVNESDQVIKLFGGGAASELVLGSNGVIYQDPMGGPTSLDILTSDLATQSTLEMDSYVTIGMMSTTEGEVNELTLSADIDFSGFELGLAPIVLSGSTEQFIAVPDNSIQGLAGDEKEVCIAQITSIGVLEGRLNVSILSNGVVYDFTEIDLQGPSGCADPTADNYDSNAVWDDGSCEFNSMPTQGCTDPGATNYDPSADTDDGSCVYPPEPGCTDPNATNYNPSAVVDDGSCIYPPEPGCTDPDATNYNPSAVVDDGSCIYPPEPGCTDPDASNYDPSADTDDGSCIYPPDTGCTDPAAVNYDDSAEEDDGTCVYAGCTNPDALNFDPIASIDNGSCIMDCADLSFGSSLNQMEDGATFELCTGVPGDQFVFQVNFTGFGPELSTVSINWGDGNEDQFDLMPLALEHEYLSSGDFQVIVTVSGIYGCTHSTEYLVHTGHTPLIDVELTSGSAEVCVAEEIGFDLMNWENNDADTQYKIQYTDDTEVYEMTHPPFIDHTHAFETPSCLSTSFDGTPFAHGIRVIAFNGCGSSFVDIPAIRVSGPNQISELSFVSTPLMEIACPGEEFTFINTSNGFYQATENGCVSTPPSDWSINPSTGWEITAGGLQDPDFLTVRFDETQQVQVSLSSASVCGSDETAHSISIAEPAGLALGEVSINGTPIPEMEVQVFAWSEENGEFILTESLLTDDAGHYETSLPEGQYQIKAHPDPIDFPGVLSLYTNGVWKWGEAEVIEVGCLSEVQADIALSEYDDNGFNVSVSGTVYYRDVVKSSQQGDPIPGIPIIVEKDTTNTQQAIVSTLTNAMGEYYFNNLPPGNYKLHIDIPGLPVAETHYFSVTQEGQSFTDLNFYADSLDRIYISDLVSVFEVQQKDTPFRIFPNPGTDIINLELIRGDLHGWELQIFDSNGREVQVDNEVIRNRWMIDCSDWPSGMYHIRANGINQSYRGTVIVN